MSQEFHEFVREWLLKAEHDIIAAQRLIEIEPMILDGACFHCQQAIEKSLKGFLTYSGKHVEKTHNINFLLEECSEINSFEPKDINDYAVEARYTDNSIIPDVEEATYYYKLAIQIYSLVKEKVVFT